MSLSVSCAGESRVEWSERVEKMSCLWSLTTDEEPNYPFVKYESPLSCLPNKLHSATSSQSSFVHILSLPLLNYKNDYSNLQLLLSFPFALFFNVSL